MSNPFITINSLANPQRTLSIAFYSPSYTKPDRSQLFTWFYSGVQWMNTKHIRKDVVVLLIGRSKSTETVICDKSKNQLPISMTNVWSRYITNTFIEQQNTRTKQQQDYMCYIILPFLSSKYWSNPLSKKTMVHRCNRVIERITLS